jgi:hypothetical protein
MAPMQHLNLSNSRQVVSRTFRVRDRNQRRMKRGSVAERDESPARASAATRSASTSQEHMLAFDGGTLSEAIATASLLGDASGDTAPESRRPAKPKPTGWGAGKRHPPNFRFQLSRSHTSRSRLWTKPFGRRTQALGS